MPNPVPVPYLERPHVMRFMDDLVKEIMSAEPEDLTGYVIEYLKKKGDSAVKANQPQPRPPAHPPNGNPAIRSDLARTLPPPPGSSDNGGFDPTWAANCLLEHVQHSLERLVSQKPEPTPAAKADLPPHPLKASIEASLKTVREKLQALTESPQPSSPSKELVKEASKELKKAGSKTNLKTQMADALFEATQLLNSNTSLDLEEVIMSVVVSVKKLLNADRCSVFLANDEKKTLRTTIEGKQFSLRYGQGIAGHVARTMCALLIPNAYEDKRFDPQVDLELGYTTRDILCLPISLDSKLVAVVQLVNKLGGHIFTQDDEVLFVSFAQFCGVRLRNAILFEEQSRLALRNKMISQMTEALANTELIETRLIPVIIKSAKTIVGADRCAFFALDSTSGEIVGHLEGVEEQLLLPSDSGVAGWVAKNKVPLNVPDAYSDKRFNKEVDSVSGYRTRNILCIPIFVDKQLVAVSQLVNKTINGEVTPFTTDDEEVLMSFASVAGVCIRNCRLFETVTARRRMMESTLKVMTDIGACDIRSLDDIMATVSRNVCASTGATSCALFVLSNDYKELSTVKAAPPPHSPPRSRSPGELGTPFFLPEKQVISVPFNESNVIANCCRSRSPARCLGLTPEQVFEAFGSAYTAKEAYFYPLVMNGEGLGVIAVLDKAEGFFNDNDQELIQLVSVVVAFWIKNSKLLTAAQYQMDEVESLRKLERLATATEEHSSTTPEDRPLDRGNSERSSSDKMPFSPGASILGAAPGFQSIPMEKVDAVMKLRPDEEMMTKLDKHDFNIHLYKDDILPQDELIPLVLMMFRRLDLFRKFHIKEDVTGKFVMLVRSKYRHVPYHNFFHAFDVTQTIFTMLINSNLDHYLPPTDQLALIIAGLVHDIDHMGLNNAFHLKAETPMGILTNLTGAKSVLEVHHCQLAIELLTYTNLLSELSHTDRSAVFKTIIDAVLATDMAVHKDIMAEVQDTLFPALNSFWSNPKAAPLVPECRRLITILLLKMADISNVTKMFDTSRKWGISVMEEFYAQGDKERQTGLEVTPMFDRKKKAELAQGQAGFINFVAKPFFLLGVKCIPSLQYLIDGINNNLATWERVLEQQRNVKQSVAHEEDDDGDAGEDD